MTLVTISALYGAGGSRVAPEVARVLDVPFLGRPALPDAEADAACEGHERGNLLSRVASLAVSWGTPSGLTADDLLPDEAHRRELEAEIRALTEGVILGRAAAAVLRGDPRALHVLLDGPEEARARQAMVIENIDHDTARRNLLRTDRLRRAYLEGLYGVEARAPGVFHLTLDSTAIALDDCVAIIAEAARRHAR